jgi:hypothetical protein
MAALQMNYSGCFVVDRPERSQLNRKAERRLSQQSRER